MPDTTIPPIEAALQAAGPEGRTVRELMEQLGVAETSIRRTTKTLLADGKAHKVATLEGQKVVWGPKPEKPPAAGKQRKSSHRRVEAARRNEQALKVLEGAGPMGMELPEIAKLLEVDDADASGFSSKAYLALRRLQQRGKVERIIRWRIVS